MRSFEEVIKQYNHVCWYPSAGNDFRALLFLSEWYYDLNHVDHGDDNAFPNLFILTDYQWLGNSFSSEEETPKYIVGDALYEDHRTRIIIKSIEQLRKLDLLYNSKLTYGDRPSAYNSVILFSVEVESKFRGSINRYRTSILYITIQNEMFVNDLIKPNNLSIEYLVLIRYGTGFLGLSYISVISNKKYVTDYSQSRESGVLTQQLNEFYSIDGKQWSNYGDVGWYSVSFN